MVPRQLHLGKVGSLIYIKSEQSGLALINIPVAALNMFVPFKLCGVCAYHTFIFS